MVNKLGNVVCKVKGGHSFDQPVIGPVDPESEHKKFHFEKYVCVHCDYVELRRNGKVVDTD